MNSAASERQRLCALLVALEDPARAAAFPADDETLVAVARRNRLTPLLSIACGATLPPALAETFRRDRVITGARNMLLGQAAEECIRALTAVGIPTIVLKGLDYETRLYEGLAARPTADIDLLVPGEHRRQGFEVLDRLGFEPRAAAPGFDEANYHEVAWTRNGVEVDLHLALAPLARCRIDYTAVWSDAEERRIGATETRVLCRPHAAIFQALHMAIDHFDVPAIYLLDLARLLPSSADLARAREIARSWRCARPFQTATALTASFLPRWAQNLNAEPPRGLGTRRVAESYGTLQPIPRREQLLRKALHFDSITDLLRYGATQARRNVREVYQLRIGRRTPRERLSLPSRPVSATPSRRPDTRSG